MIVCSCAVITDKDIELAVLDIMSQPNAPLPTPGVVYRFLERRMKCCGCAPLAVETIYAKMDELSAKGLICPCACASAQDRMVRLKPQIMPRPLAMSVDEPAHAAEHETETAGAAE
jgi:hypothetical protein